MFDFPKSKAPELTPLKNSFVYDDVENELRNLFVDLFETYLSVDAFDTNALGMSHLGTLDLVKRSINADGLVLLPGDKEEPSTRYVYRAWKSRNVQGRGLYFLKTYLQALFPENWVVEQRMQNKALPYPTDLFDRSLYENDPSKFLTSRLNIKVDATTSIPYNLSILIPIISAIIPARFLTKIILYIFAGSKTRIGAWGNPSLKLTGESHIINPNQTMKIYSFGNPCLTLSGFSNVSSN